MRDIRGIEIKKGDRIVWGSVRKGLSLGWVKDIKPDKESKYGQKGAIMIKPDNTDRVFANYYPERCCVLEKGFNT